LAMTTHTKSWILDNLGGKGIMVIWINQKSQVQHPTF